MPSIMALVYVGQFGRCSVWQVGMTTAIVHLMQGDVDGLVDDAISLGFLPMCVERTGAVVVFRAWASV